MLKTIKPGESAFVPDEDGGLMITRRKKKSLTAAEIMEQLAAIKALPGQDKPFDFNALTEDEA
jgi:hypothetical protein